MAPLGLSTVLSFLFVVGLGIWFFWLAAGKSNRVLGILLFWAILQSSLAYSGFYLDFESRPPRYLLILAPTIFVLGLLMFSPQGRAFLDRLDPALLTFMHTLRIPVELSIHEWYQAGLVPVEMSFEGQNYDIISGLTAPLIYYLVFVRKTGGAKLLFFWNAAALVLLLNIIGTSVMSAPGPLQQIAFEQPNVGIAYFPFVLLPTIIVPMVLFAHIAILRKRAKTIINT
jgi:hypothetical protein